MSFNERHPEHDDTRPEYYEGWRRETEKGTHNMSSLIPKSFDIVDIPEDRWPDFHRWGWDLFMNQIKDFNGEYAKWRVGDLRRLVTWNDRRIWLWDHNGCGDFVRISSQDMNDRFIVAFDHESERSPYGMNPEGYAPGFDFVQPIDLAMLAQSDTHPVGDGIAAMTEVYRYRYGFGYHYADTPEMADLMEPDRLITSPEVAAIGTSFAPHPVFGGEFDELRWLTPAQKRRRPKFVELYERLLAGDLPTLRELHRLLKHDLVSAVAFDTMHHIADWMLSPEDLHKKTMEEK